MLRRILGEIHIVSVLPRRGYRRDAINGPGPRGTRGKGRFLFGLCENIWIRGVKGLYGLASRIEFIALRDPTVFSSGFEDDAPKVERWGLAWEVKARSVVAEAVLCLTCLMGVAAQHDMDGVFPGQHGQPFHIGSVIPLRHRIMQIKI